MNDDHDYYEDEQLTDQELNEILEAYRKKRFVDLMIGPTASLCIHIILIVLLLLFVVPSTMNVNPPIEVTITEVVVKELDDEPPIPELEEEEINELLEELVDMKTEK